MITHKSKFHIVGYVEPTGIIDGSQKFQARIASRPIASPLTETVNVYRQDGFDSIDAAQSAIHAELAKIEEAFQVSEKAIGKTARGKSYGGK